MRADALGFFWEDRPPEKKPKAEKQKRTPPPKVWLSEDYLPGLEEAKAFKVECMVADDLQEACIRRETLVYDVESYYNYFLAAFRSVETGKVIYFEARGEDKQIHCERLRWILANFRTVGFNSNSYDLPISALACAGHTARELKYYTNKMIAEGMRPWELLREAKCKALETDHIDLIEVAPLRANLKIYGGRLHTPTLQDLPFPESTILTRDQMTCVRWYNVNADLPATATLYLALQKQVELRERMSSSLDLRSKSDAQIAEAVIAEELQQRTRTRPQRPYIAPGTVYHYQVPHFLQFGTPLMQSVLTRIAQTEFIVAETGSIEMPPEVRDFEVTIGEGIYRMGLGGLHSSEKSVAHHSDADWVLIDKDVTSYYPAIILNLGLYPKHLGPVFLQIYRGIVQKRLHAKKTGDKTTADSLKITVNGAFGKFGSRFSILYSPDLLTQVTITGQLSLLMLIERIELAGIRVVSANTDGIVIKCPRTRRHELDAIIARWEQDTGFETEENEYKALYSRDVNNYIAFKTDGTTKSKGAYVNPTSPALALLKNPASIICIEAVEAYLASGTPIMTTLLESRNIVRFITVRTVRGGAVKINPDGSIDYLGKSIRWYYAKDQEGEIVYAKSGNKVPKSDGAKPLMNLPREFPDDIDLERYAEDAKQMLIDVGAMEKEE